MPRNQTIPSMLAGRESQGLAIAGDGELALRFCDVRAISEGLAGQLAGRGIARTDRIAIVTRNGPEAALAFLAAATAGIAAPLNPAYRQQEFEFGLRDLPAKVLLTDGTAPAAETAAAALGIPALTLTTLFTI